MTQTKILQNLLVMLTAEFVLGAMLMTVTEFELDEMTGVTWMILGLHVLVALGILVHAIIYVAKTERKVPAVAALVGVVVAAAAGSVLMSVDSSWLSFTMALGFIGAFVVYGKELFRVGRHAST